jgi:hypothetical protein
MQRGSLKRVEKKFEDGIGSNEVHDIHGVSDESLKAVVGLKLWATSTSFRPVPVPDREWGRLDAVAGFRLRHDLTYPGDQGNSAV